MYFYITYVYLDIPSTDSENYWECKIAECKIAKFEQLPMMLQTKVTIKFSMTRKKVASSLQFPRCFCKQFGKT